MHFPSDLHLHLHLHFAREKISQPTMLPFARLCPSVAWRGPGLATRAFSATATMARTNTSTRTKENVHDLKTFFELIGRNTVEHLDTFEGNLDKFLGSTSKQMKAQGIDVSTRRYMLRWKNKFVNDLEPLREHKRGKKRNGGERKAKTVKAKRVALQRMEEKERYLKEEMEAERLGAREF